MSEARLGLRNLKAATRLRLRSVLRAVRPAERVGLRRTAEVPDRKRFPGVSGGGDARRLLPTLKDDFDVAIDVREERRQDERPVLRLGSRGVPLVLAQARASAEREVVLAALERGLDRQRGGLELLEPARRRLRSPATAVSKFEMLSAIDSTLAEMLLI